MAASCAAFNAVIALATLWRSVIKDADVYVVFPNVNDPFGKCFCVPAMSASTAAKAAALVFDFVMDMASVSPFSRAHIAGMASRTEQDAPGGCASFRLPLWRHSDGGLGFRGLEAEIDTVGCRLSVSGRKDEGGCT